MKLKLAIIFCLTIAFSGQGQIANLNLINSKTKQWISFTGSTSRYSEFYLVTKKSDSCSTLKISVSSQRVKSFVDSLKKTGFKEKVNFLIDKKDDYSNSLELISCSFKRLDGSDSVFTFSYKVTLQNLKSNK